MYNDIEYQYLWNLAQAPEKREMATPVKPKKFLCWRNLSDPHIRPDTGLSYFIFA